LFAGYSPSFERPGGFRNISFAGLWIEPNSGLRLAAKRVSDGKMNRQQLLDLYFLEARARLIDLAAFLDRMDRAQGEADFRLAALKRALGELCREDGRRAENVLLSLSDPTKEPIPTATTKGACGAWPAES